MNENKVGWVEVSLWLPLTLHRNDGTDQPIFTRVYEVYDLKQDLHKESTLCVDGLWCIVDLVPKTQYEPIKASAYITDTTKEGYLQTLQVNGWKLNEGGARSYDATKFLVG